MWRVFFFKDGREEWEDFKNYNTALSWAELVVRNRFELVGIKRVA